MIFLFFGTSLALLEAELAPFKDLEEIGNICEFSVQPVAAKSSLSSSALIKRNKNYWIYPLSIRSTGTSPLYPPAGTSGWLSEYWLRLIKADDDNDDFL